MAFDVVSVMISLHSNKILSTGTRQIFMDIQELQQQIEKNSASIESSKKAIGSVLDLLEKISNAVDEGFRTINARLAALEGKEGMQGVNAQLGEIKHELHKIQKAYPYDDLFNNIQSIQPGEA